MAPEEGSDQKPQADISAILNQMWVRFLPDIYERVEVLESAAKAHVAGTLSPGQCAAAHAAAHKLIGSLGTFGLMRGTELAREFEHACASEKAVMATEPSRLDDIAVQIRKIIDERK
jgi:HPt (histidine-containing phosphotransfer) domain-containing protein